MPYRIRHGSGAKPFQIVNLLTGKVVGTSATRQSAQGSIGHRMDAEGKNPKAYKRVVNNKLPYYGETDLAKKTIKINKTMSKKHPVHKRPLNKHAKKYPEVLDTIAHEIHHVMHPKKLEKNVRKATKRLIKKMTPGQKRKHYNLFK